MICIGYNDCDKKREIEHYKAAHDISHAVVISADDFPLVISGADQVDYSDVIKYAVFYPLLQVIDKNTLVVLNEVLRTQNRYDLTYNCIRHYLSQTDHCLVFQQLPLIDNREDFMILFDFATHSQWKRRKFDIDLVLDNAKVCVNPLPIGFEAVAVPTTPQTQKKYTKEKKKRFAALGAKDPHTIPRNLYLIGGKDKLAYIDSQEQEQEQLPLLRNGNCAHPSQYVARNKRLKRDNITTYNDDVVEEGAYTVVEFPHRFIEFSDFIKHAGQWHSHVLLADLKVDHWYFSRYQEWSKRIHDLYADLQQ